MNIRPNEMNLYQDPDDIPLSINLTELILLKTLVGDCTLGDATEERVRLYVELCRTLNEVATLLKDLNDPWGELL